MLDYGLGGSLFLAEEYHVDPRSKVFKKSAYIADLVARRFSRKESKPKGICRFSAGLIKISQPGAT